MKVCFATVVDGWYQGYIAPYLWCLHRAYPEYDATVFVRDELSPETALALRDLDFDNHKVVTGELDGYPEQRHVTASLRWLLFTEERVGRFFAAYDYVYINDADILVMPESPPLAEQHTAHMEMLGLPYSNVVRDYDPPCLTGCHFASAGYVRQVAPTVTRCDALFRQRGMGIVDEARIPDERLLYQIVRESGVGLPPRHDSSEVDEAALFDPARFGETWFRPHHGVHLGIGRDPKRFRHLYRTDYYRAYFERLFDYGDEFEAVCEGMHPRARGLLLNTVRGYLDHS